MRKLTFYSNSSRPRAGAVSPRPVPAAEARELPDQPSATSSAAASARKPRFTWRGFYRRYDRPLWVVAGAAFAMLLVFIHAAFTPSARGIDQKDIDAAVLHTLQTNTLPSRAAKAYDVIRPSVVRVRGLGYGPPADDMAEASIGTGVVIVESGVILTSLHVVAGAERIHVTFADGLESEARIVGAQPENDLAVLQARNLPDDLVPATMRSTQDLLLGDDVVAVGFPFGIGPSVSAGVISGLRREYRTPEGERLLTNLIQFDAAVNPGSSGGPLVTADGEVVGIVVSILNPTQRSFFVGIGFAVPIENAAAAAGIPPF